VDDNKTLIVIVVVIAFALTLIIGFDLSYQRAENEIGLEMVKNGASPIEALAWQDANISAIVATACE
jgi:hypothetical protein